LLIYLCIIVTRNTGNEMEQNTAGTFEGKIIGAGFQKTGTSTLREALKILGYKVKDCTDRALIPILKQDFKSVLKILDGYDAAEDTPWYMIYKELDELIPNSKFILTVREKESWYTSVSRHIGDLRLASHEWIYGRGKGLPKYHKTNSLQVYERHNREVRDYFKNRPRDLLVLDFAAGDQWEKLCNFLGHDIPDVPFPHYNNSKAPQKQRSALSQKWRHLRKQFKSNFKIKYLEWRGWL